jgi:hypothetical protein
MLAVLLAMLLIDPIQYAMTGRYGELSHALQHDPGTFGLHVLMVMLCFNALMQVGIQTFSCTSWRCFVLMATTFYGLFFLIHQVIHVANGEPLGLRTVLDVTHQLLAMAATVAAWRWKKESYSLPQAHIA